MKTNFMNRIAKIIEEISSRTCIDEIEAEIIEEILKYELRTYYTELEEYYDTGYIAGYGDGSSKSRSAV